MANTPEITRPGKSLKLSADVIIARWEKLTGQKAVKLEG